MRNKTLFYPNFNNQGFQLYYTPKGFIDEKPVIVTNITSLLVLLILILTGLWWLILFLLPLTIFYSWGSLFIKLPFKTNTQGRSPRYGLGIHKIYNIRLAIALMLGRKTLVILFKLKPMFIEVGVMDT